MAAASHTHAAASQTMPPAKETGKTCRDFGGTRHVLCAVMYAEKYSGRLPSATVACCHERDEEEALQAFMSYDKSVFVASVLGEAAAFRTTARPSP